MKITILRVIIIVINMRRRNKNVCACVCNNEFVIVKKQENLKMNIIPKSKMIFKQG